MNYLLQDANSLKNATNPVLIFEFSNLAFKIQVNIQKICQWSVAQW